MINISSPGHGQIFPVKVHLVENNRIEHLDIGKKTPVGRQLATAGRAAEEGEACLFFPGWELLEYALNILFGIFGVT